MNKEPRRIFVSEERTLEEKKKELEDAGFTVDYLTVKDKRLFAAAFLENVRLIDNVEYK